VGVVVRDSNQTETHRQGTGAVRDLIVLALAGICALTLISVFEPILSIVAWTEGYERWVVAEFGRLLIVLAFVLAVFAVRRWTELRSYIKECRWVEDALQVSEERLRTVVANAPVIVFAMDRDGVLTLTEGRGLEALGLQPGERVGESFFDVYGDVPGAVEKARQALAGEAVTVTLQGTRVAFETHFTPMRDNAGEVTGVIGVAIDVTEHRRAEEALRQSEAKYRRIFEDVQDIFYRTDATGIITEIGPVVAKYGYTQEELIGTQVLDIYEDPEQRSDLLKALSEQGEVVDYEVRLKTGDGRVRDASVSAHILRDAGGTFIGVEGTLRDISERKRMEQALRESEERYRELFENANDMVYTHDLEGRFTSVNRAAEQISGYTREEAFANNFATILAPEYLSVAREAILRKLRGEPSTTYEVEIITKDGRRAPVELSTRLIHKDGKPVGVQGIARDISERKRAEDALRRSEASLVEAQRVAHLGNWDWNIETNALWWSDEMYRIFGLAPQGFGATYEAFLETIHPDDRGLVEEAVNKALHEGVPYSIDYRVVLPDGLERIAHAEGEVTRDDAGKPVRMVGIVQDISERKRAEQALRESEERYRSLIETSPDAITLTDLQMNIVVVNQQAVALHGCDGPEDMIGHSALDFFDPEDRPRAEENTRKALDVGSVKNIEYTLLRKDGTRFPAELSASVVADGEGRPQFLIGVVRDIRERKRFEGQLVHLANHDALTDLFNRRRFGEELTRQLAQAQRYGTPGALLFIDLDQFKDLNDSLGHRAGDELLTRLAVLLRERLRETDVVARVGGDEFAVLLPHTDGEQAEAVAEQLLEMIRRYTFVVAGQPIHVTASMGVAFFPEGEAAADDMFSRADLAMYDAKEKGRNGYRIYKPNGEWRAQIEQRLGWQHRIREALKKNRFALYAQPILDLSTNEVSQYELLLRLDGGGKTVAASAFVDVAERFGLIQEIDRWVVRRAIQLISKHQQDGRDVRLEVNLSGKAFADPELLPLIRRELKATAIDPASLVLEVTETAAIANISEAQKFVATLKGLGCRFALDDFGVGFSSFYHLKHLPVDYLKIDGSFIQQLPGSPVDQHLVQAMVQVARGLGKQSIAEFVSDEETEHLLREYGVDYAQGYYIGRPRKVVGMLPRRKRKSLRAA
jgi:diguanylate cyclase (GGDEF)-like protein/PAS domain S-box-containing protein